MLMGFLIALVISPFYYVPSVWLILWILPGAVDGIIQMKTKYESNNLRRLWTGLFMGTGSMILLIHTFQWAYWLGRSMGKNIFHLTF